MTNTKYLLQIQKNMTRFFNKAEFRELCLHLDFEYDHLAGRSFPDKALEFVKELERNGRLPELITHLQNVRPKPV